MKLQYSRKWAKFQGGKGQKKRAAFLNKVALFQLEELLNIRCGDLFSFCCRIILNGSDVFGDVGF